MADDLAPLWFIHTSDKAQQRGFTRTIGTNQPHAYPGGDRQVDILEYPVAAMVVVVAFVEVFYLDHWVSLVMSKG